MAEYLDYEGLKEYTNLIRKYTQPWIAALPNTSASDNGHILASGQGGYFSAFGTVKEYFELAAKDPNFCAPLILHIESANLANHVTQIRMQYEEEILSDCGDPTGCYDYIDHTVDNIDIYFPTEFDPSYSSSLSGTFALYRTDSNTWYAVGYGTQLYPKDVAALKTTLSRLHSGGIS